MHELSVAENILSIVRQYVKPEDESRINAIHLKVGAMSGVVVESLEFCFTAITAETPMRAAPLRVERIPFRISCFSCGQSSEASYGQSVCPSCGSTETKIVSGTELQVTEIELQD